MNATSEYLKQAKETTAESAETVNQQVQDTFAKALSEFSGSVNSIAKKLRGKNMSEAFDDAKGVAERNPTLIIAGGLAIGMGVALLVSSRR